MTDAHSRCSSKTWSEFVTDTCTTQRGPKWRAQDFASYSHKDKKSLEEFEKHLKPYLRNRWITSWSDQQIKPGSRAVAPVAAGPPKDFRGAASYLADSITPPPPPLHLELIELFELVSQPGTRYVKGEHSRQMRLGFVAGIILTLVVVIGAGFVAVETGMVAASADSKPGVLETWVAQAALNAALARDTKGLNNPLQPADDNLIAGVHLYPANCVICHGASDAKPSKPARGFYIKAPQLAKDGVEDDPESATFWTIKHGIRFTAMPSFSTTLNDEDIWKVAMFLKKMDKLPPAVDAEWKKVLSAAATP